MKAQPKPQKGGVYEGWRGRERRRKINELKHKYISVSKSTTISHVFHAWLIFIGLSFADIQC